jgi:radical SAM-linked protein
MRIRITFTKTGALRYTSHLDLHQVWERTVRRAGLPLAYTQGFHPGPKIQVAAALPLGFIGLAEVVDLWLHDKAEGTPAEDPGAYKDMLQSAAPPGLVLLSVEEVDERSPALQTQVVSAEYTVTLLETGAVPGLEAKLGQVLASTSLPRERRGKKYDLRPLIEGLEICAGDDRVPGVWMRLAAREGATGRPEEVLGELGIPFETTRIERTRLILRDAVE